MSITSSCLHNSIYEMHQILCEKVAVSLAAVLPYSSLPTIQLLCKQPFKSHLSKQDQDEWLCSVSSVSICTTNIKTCLICTHREINCVGIDVKGRATKEDKAFLFSFHLCLPISGYLDTETDLLKHLQSYFLHKKNPQHLIIHVQQTYTTKQSSIHLVSTRKLRGMHCCVSSGKQEKYV